METLETDRMYTETGELRKETDEEEQTPQIKEIDLYNPNFQRQNSVAIPLSPMKGKNHYSIQIPETTLQSYPILVKWILIYYSSVIFSCILALAMGYLTDDPRIRIEISFCLLGLTSSIASSTLIFDKSSEYIFGQKKLFFFNSFMTILFSIGISEIHLRFLKSEGLAYIIFAIPSFSGVILLISHMMRKGKCLVRTNKVKAGEEIVESDEKPVENNGEDSPLGRVIILLVLLGQCLFCLFLGVIYVRFGKISTLYLVIACSLYPVGVGIFKLVAFYFDYKFSCNLTFKISYISFIFAALPYRFLFLAFNTYETAAFVFGVKLVYKVLFYTIFIFFQAKIRDKITKSVSWTYKKRQIQINADFAALVAKQFNTLNLCDIHEIISVFIVIVSIKFIIPIQDSRISVLSYDQIYRIGFLSLIELGFDLVAWIGVSRILQKILINFRILSFKGLVVASLIRYRWFSFWNNLNLFLLISIILINDLSF